MARRLARADRWRDALPYYPTELLRDAERQVEDLDRADELALPAPVRARSLWSAGTRMRELGMELTGTEIEPDWRWYEGNYDPPSIGYQRLAHVWEPGDELTRPTAAELDRVHHHFDFSLPRFHYRFEAAELGEQAAALLPDDHEAGARVLCQAAHWVRARDHHHANRLIREMVNRNPNIAMAHYGDHLLDGPVGGACSLDGIDFAAPSYVPRPTPVEPRAWWNPVLAMLRQGWPFAMGLALLVLFGLMMLGGREKSKPSSA